MQWGIFSDESADDTEDEAVEVDFYSREDAETAVKCRYSPEDDLHVHAIEEPEDEEEDDE